MYEQRSNTVDYNSALLVLYYLFIFYLKTSVLSKLDV